MKNSKFCHLHTHGEHSSLDGLGTVKQLTTRAKELGFTHLAYTNHGNIDGLIQFQKACDDIGLKPVLGCEMYIVPKILEKNKNEKKGHIILLVKNQSGWKDLCKMLTKANTDGFYYKPRIDYDMLLSCDLSGLVILTACMKSFVYLPMGEAFLWDLTEKTKDVYIEIMPHCSLEGIKEHNERMSLLRMKYGLKFCATNDVHYIRKEDYKTHEVLLAMQTKSKMSDSKRWKFDERGLYLRTANEMIRAFSSQGFFDKDTVISALKNTIKIAEKCESFRVPKCQISLPPILKKNNDDDYLDKLCRESLFLKKKKKYLKRMKVELKTIKEKKFSRYFLIVRDLVRWCKNNDILVGPGRGSCGGSLCAYLIGITTIDPIKYKLLFSRFINKDRIDFPDIDLDFEHNKRGLVIDYLKKKYGENQVAGVSTFLTMQGKAVVRDVARVFDVPLKDVNEFTKAIYVDSESESSLNDSLSTFEGKCFQKKYPDVVEHALKLEGQIKAVGTHAAAVVVSPVDLYTSNRGNLCVRGNAENKSTVINWEMSDADYVGLMKLDILGLNTLTILNEAKRLTGKIIDFSKIKPLNKEVFAEMSKGETVGLFQMSTSMMTETIKRMGISNFNDMAASLALVRPGPLESGMAEDYILRKNGKSWEKKHPVYEEITKDTYGVVIYQEQVMQVINKVAGLSYSVADEIRKVIGKKRHSSEFEPYRKKFLEGCLKTKIFSAKEAQWFWDMILKCARYLFNKSHAVEYAMLAYWTGYFKYRYPNEFITACLTYGSEKKKDEYIREAKRMGIAIMPPKIGLSDNFKWKIIDKTIYVPFIEIKGMGEKTVEKIKQFENRKRGLFNSDLQIQGKIGELLNAVGAFSPNAIVPDIGKYFSFNIGSPVLLKKIPFKGYSNKEKLIDCKACSLRGECSHPVMPCAGRYNIAILGEAPGQTEEQEGTPFIGKAGKLLFDTIRKHGAERHWFHVTNVCKCYPSKTKTPQREHINACSVWLKDELKSIQCSLILSLGATSLYALTGQEGGIMNMNGKLEYNNTTKCMVMYCLHPAAVLRDPNKSEMFNSAIKSFVNLVNRSRNNVS